MNIRRMFLACVALVTLVPMVCAEEQLEEPPLPPAPEDVYSFPSDRASFVCTTVEGLETLLTESYGSADPPKRGSPFSLKRSYVASLGCAAIYSHPDKPETMTIAPERWFASYESWMLIVRFRSTNSGAECWGIMSVIDRAPQESL